MHNADADAKQPRHSAEAHTHVLRPDEQHLAEPHVLMPITMQTNPEPDWAVILPNSFLEGLALPMLTLEVVSGFWLISYPCMDITLNIASA